MTSDELYTLSERFRNALSAERLKEEIMFIHSFPEIGYFQISQYGTYLITLPAEFISPKQHYFTAEQGLEMLDFALRTKEL